jgi:hypothetical protein
MMPTTAFDDSAVQRAAQHGDPLRSTALLMHTMTADDRSWVMDQLQPGQREAIALLLAELDALEFGTDGFEAGPPPAMTPRPPVQSSPNTDAQLIAALDALPAARLRAVLRGEPAALIRRIGRMHRWSWWGAVATVGGEIGADHVLTAPAMAEPSLSAPDRAVLNALRERVNAPCPAAEAQDDRPRRWRSTAAALRHHLGRVARSFARENSPKPN